MKSFDKTWEEIHATNEWGRYPSEDVVRFVARNFYKLDRKNTKILDFGCGAGANTFFLAKEGFDTYAFDGSTSAVKKTNDYLSRETLRANVIVSDALELPYEDDFFECIIDSAAIYANNESDIELMYKECYRMLRNGGYLFSGGLFSTDMYVNGTGIKVSNNTYRNISDGALANIGVVHFSTHNEIYETLTDIGFHSIKIDKVHRTDNGSNIIYYLASCQR